MPWPKGKPFGTHTAEAKAKMSQSSRLQPRWEGAALEAEFARRDAKEPPGKLLSTADVAALKGVWAENIALACKEGRLLARKVGHTYVIAKRDARLWTPTGSRHREDSFRS